MRKLITIYCTSVVIQSIPTSIRTAFRKSCEYSIIVRLCVFGMERKALICHICGAETKRFANHIASAHKLTNFKQEKGQHALVTCRPSTSAVSFSISALSGGSRNLQNGAGPSRSLHLLPPLPSSPHPLEFFALRADSEYGFRPRWRVSCIVVDTYSK